MSAFFLAVTLAAPVRAGSSDLSQNITVHGKAFGPELSVPPPAPSRPVVDEALNSLTLGLGAPIRPETVRVSPDTTALRSPFPESPFFALSPKNIHALYDAWSFEVIADDGEIAGRLEGVGLLREIVDWSGFGPDGRFTLAAGRHYFYRFNGRRAKREFTIKSDPVLIRSFMRREYGGQTRLEVAASELFRDGTSAYAQSAQQYIDTIANALHAAGTQPGDSERFTLRARQPLGKLAAERAQALKKTLAAGLLVNPDQVKIQLAPVGRSEAFVVMVPPSPGQRIGNE